jgi:hypothetical protein
MGERLRVGGLCSLPALRRVVRRDATGLRADLAWFVARPPSRAVGFAALENCRMQCNPGASEHQVFLWIARWDAVCGGAKYRILEAYLIRPIAVTFVMLVQADLLGSIQRRR